MNVAEIEKKVETVETPKVTKVASAFSGGLDSSLGIELLRRKYKAEEIVPITIDIGQGEEEIEQCTEHAKALEIEPIVIDVKKEFADEWLTMAIKANSNYGGYPVSTSMTRQLMILLIWSFFETGTFGPPLQI